jgi:hypothetical protein
MSSPSTMLNVARHVMVSEERSAVACMQATLSAAEKAAGNRHQSAAGRPLKSS